MVLDSEVAYLKATEGTPLNDTDPYGGAITATTLDQTLINLLIDKVYIDALLDKTYYGAAYRKNTNSTDTATDLVMSNRAGAILNLATSTPFIQSTSASDTGSILLVGKTGGSWGEFEWDVTGTTAAAYDGSCDVGTARRWQYFNPSGSPAIPYGNLTGSVGGQICTVMYGSNGGNGRQMTSAEYAVALATAITTALGSFTNRTTAPTGVSAFASGAKWTGLDETITVPGGGSLAPNAYIGYVIRLILLAGIPRPRGMGLRSSFGLVGAA